MAKFLEGKRDRDLPEIDALAGHLDEPAHAVGLEEGYALLSDLGLHEGAYSARHWGLGLAIGEAQVVSQ